MQKQTDRNETKRQKVPIEKKMIDFDIVSNEEIEGYLKSNNTSCVDTIPPAQLPLSPPPLLFHLSSSPASLRPPACHHSPIDNNAFLNERRRHVDVVGKVIQNCSVY